ncbi:YkyA family protein [Metabacillus schmidteae]|uniref:YkyA family protein n=1 Tax=Metabacillus schmidteae TaxID=2730405 RepID=UPI00158A32F2|nr:YkyA family protein [Metabacillus schmidteae]
MLKKQSVFILLICTVLLTGCFGPSPEENIYQILEDVASQEDTFKQQQKPLLELEKKESELYNKIMDLGMSEFDQVVSLSKEALTVIEDREKKLQKEHESIVASKEKFEEITTEIENITDEPIQEAANQLKTTMEDRYKSYETLFENYETSLSLDKELYTMLQKKDLTIEEFETHLTKINAAYKTVIEQNEEFNKLTEQYNKQKMDFYKKAELNVETK